MRKKFYRQLALFSSWLLKLSFEKYFDIDLTPPPYESCNSITIFETERWVNISTLNKNGEGFHTIRKDLKYDKR